MELIKKLQKKDETKITYASFLKTDYIENSITISMDDKTKEVYSVYITELKMGNLSWDRGSETFDLHRWESEDEAMETSSLNKYFTRIVSDGLVSSVNYENMFLNRILELVLDSDKLEIIHKMRLVKLLKELRDRKDRIYLN